MEAAITLRKARNDDIPLITGMLEENGLPATDVPEKIASLFVILSDRRPVGTGGVELLGRYALLRSLAVQREEQNRGYGAATVRRLMRHAAEKGVTELYLLTTDAEAFFKRLGFEQIDRDSAPLPVKGTSQLSGL
jgi:amino-acid N-acetyltransferase